MSLSMKVTSNQPRAGVNFILNKMPLVWAFLLFVRPEWVVIYLLTTQRNALQQHLILLDAQEFVPFLVHLAIPLLSPLNCLCAMAIAMSVSLFPSAFVCLPFFANCDHFYYFFKAKQQPPQDHVCCCWKPRKKWREEKRKRRTLF